MTCAKIPQRRDCEEARGYLAVHRSSEPQPTFHCPRRVSIACCDFVLNSRLNLFVCACAFSAHLKPYLPRVRPSVSLRMLWLALCVVTRELMASRHSPKPELGCRVDSSGGGGAVGRTQGQEEKKTAAGSASAAQGSLSVSAASSADARTIIFCDGVSAPVPLLRLAGPVRRGLVCFTRVGICMCWCGMDISG